MNSYKAMIHHSKFRSEFVRTTTTERIDAETKGDAINHIKSMYPGCSVQQIRKMPARKAD